MSDAEAITWSPQQAAFIDWAEHGTGSCVLEAVAGAGKTTTLIRAAEVIDGQVAIMAYNKKIAEEIKAKLLRAGLDWKKAQGGTAHSFGFQAYCKAMGHTRQTPTLTIDENKVRDLVDAALPETHPLAQFKKGIEELVSLAKQTAIGIVCSVQAVQKWQDMADHFDVFDEEAEGEVDPEVKLQVLRLARDLLVRSTEMRKVIDFDDMIYMPLVHKCRFWQFQVVMVDEAQDTNAARRALVRAMLRRGGRVIAVGDRHQAIYGFTGADSDALDLIAQDHNCRRLPLTVSYRCPQTVVAFARQWVSHIEAAPTAPQGSVTTQTHEDFLRRNDLDGRSAVLSRTTKPLVALAFRLIRQRTPCRIEGSDVAARIKKLINRWKVKSLDALEVRLETYLAKETTKLLAKKQESKLAGVEDAVETVRVIIDQCRQEKRTAVQDAVNYVDELFADNVQDILTLSTIHKAKGREWLRVFWLDRRGTCPNKWARQEWQCQAEVNLMYVAATRAQEELVDLLAPEVVK